MCKWPKSPYLPTKKEKLTTWRSVSPCIFIFATASRDTLLSVDSVFTQPVGASLECGEQVVLAHEVGYHVHSFQA